MASVAATTAFCRIPSVYGSRFASPCNRLQLLSNLSIKPRQVWLSNATTTVGFAHSFPSMEKIVLPSIASRTPHPYGSLTIVSKKGYKMKTHKFAPSSNDADVPRFTLPIDYFSSSRGGIGTSRAIAGSICMEKLLIHCAIALEMHDSTSAQQILWVLNNIASPDGDSSQRLTASFLRALVTRASQKGTATPNSLQPLLCYTELPVQRLSVLEFAGFLDLTPWYRFGFSAANATIVEAVESFSAVRIIDLSLSHCMQWPTLIDSISNRMESAPFITLKVFSGAISSILTEINMPYNELGIRLTNFAHSRGVRLDFSVVPFDGIASLTDGLRKERLELMVQRMNCAGEEALVVNCQMLLHYIPDETLDYSNRSSSSGFQVAACNVSSDSSSSNSFRSEILNEIRRIEPTIVTLVEEDADLTSTNLVPRLKSAFDYLWIPFDAVDTFLPRESKQRIEYETGICPKIENIVAFEGERRMERLESKGRWVQRMERASFYNIGFAKETVEELKGFMEEHAAGWGMKKEDEDLVLTWKGHNVVFATAWVPI